MRLNEFQELSKRTLPKGELKDKLANYGMGIAGEAAEVTDELKKVVFHGHDLSVDKVKKELGDNLHYIAGIATFLGLTLEEIAYENIQKLKERYPTGFSEEASRNRVI
ncbi:nucleotide pyrophosphohydrolase [Siminovitchia terrae]|uniref:nucleoside triphosphate pyrophosphohydrolase family protein n=1 Tax=Siminovitchia terrae TaxID=1914933 RepID=UPI001B27B31A|nr:nucleoside triphosphate pyrophosphohydrolase family protein [Siminovitchia terrae]GIN93350.1 nucleotide pyrophosphohydrolase [Siminovitchia terrae]